MGRTTGAYSSKYGGRTCSNRLGGATPCTVPQSRLVPVIRIGLFEGSLHNYHYWGGAKGPDGRKDRVRREQLFPRRFRVLEKRSFNLD